MGQRQISRLVRATLLLAIAVAASTHAGHRPGSADSPETGDLLPLVHTARLPALSRDSATTPGAERNCAIVADGQTVPSSPDVEARLLTTSDLGLGWSVWTGDGDDDDWVWFYHPARLPGEVAAAWSLYWEKGWAGLDEHVTAYDSPSRAREMFTEVARHEACIAANINAGKANANSQGWQFSNASSVNVAFPTVGEGALAYRLMYDFSCGPGCAEVDTQFRIWVLTGKYLVAVHLYGYDIGEDLPIPAAEFEGIVMRAVERASE